MNDPMKVMEKQDLEPVTTLDIGTVDEPVQENADHLHRRLGNRQIQLIAIGTLQSSHHDRLLRLTWCSQAGRSGQVSS